MRADTVADTVADMRAEVLTAMVSRRIPAKAFAEQWQTTELTEDVRRVLNVDLPIVEWGREEGIDETGMRERIERAVDAHMAAKAANFGPDTMRFIEKSILLQLLDAVWKEHLLALDHLRQGIGLRAYGQRDPLNEYKSEAFAMFNAMLDDLKERVTQVLTRVEIGPEPVPPPPIRMVESHPTPAMAEAAMAEPLYEMAGAEQGRVTALPMRSEQVDPSDPSTWGRSPRNAPCPCGSGKKFKHCHGRTDVGAAMADAAQAYVPQRPALALTYAEFAAFTRNRRPASDDIDALVASAPCGDGSAVLVLPTSLRNDGQTELLRSVLGRLGYRAFGWELGVNLGPTRALLDGSHARLRALAAEHGRVALVGFSMGGLFARWLANGDASLVRQVLTAGSPARAPARSAFVPESLLAKAWPGRDLADLAARTERALEVPGTYIYSRRDGVVAWESCLEPAAPEDNFEVDCHHVDMPFDLEVFRIVAVRLARMIDG